MNVIIKTQDLKVGTEKSTTDKSQKIEKFNYQQIVSPNMLTPHIANCLIA